MPQLTRLALALLLSTLTACGGKSHASPDDDGTGGTNAGGTGNGTSGSSTGGKGHAGSAGAGVDACTVFDDEAPGSIRVSISNLTAAPIYLGQDTVTCGVTPLFHVADADGTPLPALGDCRSPCTSLRQQGVGGCLGICLFPSVVALQPNEILYTSWDGLFSVPGELPGKCVPFESGATTVACDQAKRIEPGNFLFSASAGSGLDCSQTTGTGSCSPCTASPNGGCSTSGSLVTGTTHTTQTFVLLNESYGVFPASSANPGPNGDAELPAPGDPITPPTVELIFTE